MNAQQVFDQLLGPLGALVLCLVVIVFLYRMYRAEANKVDELQAQLVADAKDGAEMARAYLKLAQERETRP